MHGFVAGWLARHASIRCINKKQDVNVLTYFGIAMSQTQKTVGRSGISCICAIYRLLCRNPPCSRQTWVSKYSGKS